MITLLSHCRIQAAQLVRTAPYALLALDCGTQVRTGASSENLIVICSTGIGRGIVHVLRRSRREIALVKLDKNTKFLEVTRFVVKAHGLAVANQQTIVWAPGGVGSRGSDDERLCQQVPPLVSAFVDALVDHAFSGEFVGPAVRPFRPFEQGKKETMDLMLPPWDRIAPPIVTRLSTPERLVAIGDLHGDLEKSKEALKVAMLIDDNSKWIGGKTMVVQVGDILDRGGDELKILYFLERLKREAARAGGSVHVLQGNHELLNASGSMIYVTESSLVEFKTWGYWHKMGNALKQKCKGLSEPFDFFKDIPTAGYGSGKDWNVQFPLDLGFVARMAAFRPGGPISSRFLAGNPAVLVVGENIFVHGGLHADYHRNLEKINRDTRDWLLGKDEWTLPASLGPHGLSPNLALLWSREYSKANINLVNCELLERTLMTVPGAKRMVVGHTPQPKGINSACGGKSCRIDVGLSRGMLNGRAQVLEIYNGKLTVLTAHGREPLKD